MQPSRFDLIDSILSRDPAARHRWEVLLCYPGFHAILWHRLAHGLWSWGARLLARMIAALSRFLTGIEIHPAAKIGRRCFIDHGMGVVIGETVAIGDDVTLYQGVTLGGTALDAHTKRHPTVESRVIVGAGAMVLGPITLGAGCRVGANAVVLRDVPKGVTVTGIPARPVGRGTQDQEESFLAYGLPCDEIPDPVAQEICRLSTELAQLREKLADMQDGKG